MTQQEKSIIVNEILNQLQTDARLIEDLEPVDKLKDTDLIEISGGRRVSIKELRGAGVDIQKLYDAFIRRDQPDRTPYMLSSDTGFEVGDFLAGVSGGRVAIDKETGHSYAELDRLYVRVRAYFESLTVIEREALAGEQQVTPGGGVKCTSVDEVRDANGNLTGWRCYFLSEQDGEKRETKIIAGDQAIAQTFNAKTGTSNKVSNKRWWRLVTAVSNDAYTDDAGNHYGYIEVSRSDCETGSGVPVAGDEIAQFGNRTDATRQAAIVISTVSSDAPSMKLFTGIGSGTTNAEHYSLSGRDIISYGYDHAKGRAYMRCYGDLWLGDKDGTSYVKYDSAAKKWLLHNVSLSVSSTIGDKTIEDYVKSIVPPVTQEDITQFVNNIVGPDLNAIKNQIDGVVETWWGEGAPTMGNYPANQWTTDAEKEKHLSDLYCDNETGFAYRFSKAPDGTYFWNDKVDTATAKALAEAAKAQDTADRKRRVFVAQPTTPYDMGDIWVNATYGAQYSNDILRCVTPKTAAQPFAISDWTLASKYTDDSALNTFISQYESTIDDIKTQADLKAETWYQPTDPSAAWDTADKAKHKGDLWYCTADIANTNFKKGTTWYWGGAAWEKQDVPESVFDAIDGKADIFVSKPTAGYHVNDLWFLEADYTLSGTAYKAGTLVVAKNNMGAAWSADDWIKKDRYTDATDIANALKDYEYLTEALKDVTTIQGGLMMTGLVRLGQYNSDITQQVVWAGINGVRTNDKSIAAWYGGDMLDKENGGTGRTAKSLFRMDGSGYLADGNITWNAMGAIRFGSGIVIDLGGGNTDTLGGLSNTLANNINLLNNVLNCFEPQDSGNNPVGWDSPNIDRIKVKKNFYSSGFVSAKGMNPDGTIAAGGLDITRLKAYLDGSDPLNTEGAYATQNWVTGKGYLTGITKSQVEAVLTGNITSHTHSQYLTSHQDISGKVDKVDGKGLSSNDFTDALLTKLNGIAAGANNYTLPTASSTALGGVKVGSGLAISSGVLSVSLAASHIPSLPISKITDLQTALNGKVAKSGDTMTGNLTLPTIIISSTEYAQHLAFSRQNWNYITAPTGGVIAFVTNGKEKGETVADLAIANDEVKPGNRNNAVILGTSSYRWKNVYSVLGNFSGKVTAQSVTIGDCEITWDAEHQGLKFSKGIYSSGFVSAKGRNPDGTIAAGGLDITRLKAYLDGSDPLNTEGAYATQNWVLGKNYLTSAALTGYATEQWVADKGYATQNWVTGKGYLTGITKSQVEAVLTGNITSHTHSQYLTSHQPLDHLNVIDSRDTATLPNSWSASFRLAFKRNSTNGLNDGDGYNGELFFKPYGNTSDFTGGYPHQLGFTTNGNIWHRIGRSATSWSAWKKLAFTSDNVASATKLQTARTLWGQPFDGTANVSGNLINVGFVRSSYGITSNQTDVKTSAGTSAYWYGLGLKRDDNKNFVTLGGYYGLRMFTAGVDVIISAGGKVGINTTAPTERLEVNGYAKASGFKVGTATGFLKADGSVDGTSYVAAVDGKGLSANDFTDTLLAKLNGIAEGANKYVLPTASSTALGGVKVGSGLVISSGVLSVSLAASHIPSLDWSKITSGKPTTLAGYGIADAYTKSEADSLLGNKADKTAVVTALGTNGNYLTWTKNGATNNLTVPYATASGAVNNLGNLAAVSDTTTMPSGLRLYSVYNNGYPTAYGNLLRIGGGGSGELLCGWSGNTSIGSLYYRSKRDVASTAWSAWAKILTDSNYASVLDNRYYTESEINTKLGSYYTKTESDGRYVNATGDTMTGDLIFGQSNTTTRSIRFLVGGSDMGRIAAGATSSNAGWLEIAVADEGNETIYARQYTGAFATIKRTLTLLDASGNTIIPVSLSAPKITIGDCEITWDADNGGLKFSKGIYSMGFVSAKGIDPNGGTSSGGGVSADWLATNGYKTYADTLSGVQSWVNSQDYATKAWVEGNYLTMTDAANNYVKTLYGSDVLSGDMNEMKGNTAFIGSINANANTPNGNGWYNVIQLPHRNGASDGAGYVGQIALGMTVNHDNMYFRTHRTRAWQRVARYSDIPTSMAWSQVTGKPTIPTNTNQLTNGAGFITSAALSSYLPKSSYTASDVLAKIKSVDGSGSGLDADLLDGVHNGDITSRFIRYTNNNSIHGAVGFMQQQEGWNDYDAPGQGWYSVMKLAHGNGDTYYNRTLAFDFHSHNIWTGVMQGGAFGGWKRLAFTSDNVASATRLQGTYSLWGQNFYGNNVSGNMTGVGNINTAAAPIGTIYANNWFRSTGATGWYNETYGGGWYMTDNTYIKNYNSKRLKISGINGYYDIWIEGGGICCMEGQSGWSWNQGFGGLNVGCANNQAQTPLVVGYRTGADDPVTAGSNRLFAMELHNTGNMMHFSFAGATEFEFSHAGLFRANGGIESAGYITAKTANSSSDARLKDILGNILLDIDTMADAPSVRFKWKDTGEIAAGSIAQYWQPRLPEIVGTKDDNTLTLQYGVLGTLMAKSCAVHLRRHEHILLTHESRITRLERENREMRQEINELKRQLLNND